MTKDTDKWEQVFVWDPLLVTMYGPCTTLSLSYHVLVDYAVVDRDRFQFPLKPLCLLINNSLPANLISHAQFGSTLIRDE